MELTLSYSEVSRVLGSIHDVAEGKATAFRGRLQHLQRLRFPPGVNTGRGRAADYRASQLLLLALGLELLQLGLTPERAARVLNDNAWQVADALHTYFMARFASEPHAVYLTLNPNALSTLTGDERHDEASTSFEHVSSAELLSRIHSAAWRSNRLALVYLNAVKHALEVRLRNDLGKAASEQFDRDLYLWSKQEVAPFAKNS